MNNSSVLICPPILYPETENCSGRGACSDVNTCECEDGWTGVGDFAYGSPSCAINITAVRVLWSLTAFGASVLFILVIFVMCVQKHRRKTFKRSVNEQFMHVICVFASINSVATMYVGIIRIAYPTQRTITSDPSLAFIFAVLTCGLLHMNISFIIYTTFRSFVLQTDMMYLSQKEKLLYRFRGVVMIYEIYSSCFAWILLGLITARSAEEVRVYVTLHYVCLGTAVLAAGAITHFVVKPIIKALSVEMPNDTRYNQRLDLRGRLSQFAIVAQLNALIVGTVAYLFGLWPFFQIEGSSYLLPIVYASTVAFQCDFINKFGKNMKSAEAANESRGSKFGVLSTVYLRTKTDMDQLQQQESMVKERRELQVGHDTVIAFMGNRIAIMCYKVLENPTYQRCLMVFVFIGGQIIDTLVWIGVMPTWVCILTGSLYTLNFIFLSCVSVSLSMIRHLFKLPEIIMRLIVWMVHVVLLCIVLADVRCLSAVGMNLLVLLTIFSDAFVMEVGLVGLRGLLLFSCCVLVKNFVLLQFDLISPRSNTFLYLFGDDLVWSTFQASRDYGLSLMLFCMKDFIQLLFSPMYFVRIQSAVNVRIVSLSLQAKRTTLNRHSKRVNAVVQSSVQNPLAASLLIDRELLLLQEKDSIVVKCFGIETGGQILDVLGKPRVRIIQQLCLAIALVLFVAFILPGLIPPATTFCVYVACVPLLGSLFLKNIELIRVLTMRMEFVAELMFVVFVLSVFGIILGDLRSVAMPLLLWLWLDFRLSDSICVFYHSGFRGRAYHNSALWKSARRIILTAVIISTLLAIPVLLYLQIIPNANVDLGFNLRAAVNMTNATDDDASGAFARVKLYQFVSDFFSVFCISMTIDIAIDANRKRKSQIYQKDIHVPIKRIWIQAGLAPSRKIENNKDLVARVLNSNATVIFSSEEEEEEGPVHG